ncbi:hypothetical protein BD310DRAFT_958775 [Dichomitus squalens]|uniref:DUF7704 domain-containing protein n=1 Tax=Dichomitus squalens TaxID=114155 RepID=A0A4Q9PVY3_9APHY|nr:hypothetical protein BD310DRAFT_958775 [Dichomitus squalens]
MSSSVDLSVIPLAYRLFFLYIEPLSAIVGAIYAGGLPAQYLAYLTSSPTAAALTRIATPPTATLISLYQLSNLYLLFALNEHFVLKSTSSVRTWRALLFGLLTADFGHLATMIPLAQEKGWAEVFLRFWAWNAMEWGSVGFVYAGASMRTSFLLGLGFGKGAKLSKKD